MAESKRDLIPEHFASIEEAGDFWDTHDLTDYMDLTEEVTATIDLQRRRYLVALAPDIAMRLGVEARRQGVSAETLLNLWLNERLRATIA
jgi:hypothetical protein